jgi:hypothetical protein
MTVKLDEWTEPEKLALASLVRLMVRMDGTFSRTEAAVLQDAANELGSDEFWGLVESAALRDNQSEDQVREIAQAVERPDIRETIYGVLYILALEDALGTNERKLLEWLEEVWNIKAE